MIVAPEIHPKHPLPVGSVYLLDDHEVVRRGLRQLLESNGLSVAGESASAREAARRIPGIAPDLVILDDDLTDGSGADVCRTVSAAIPTIRCVLMTGAADKAVLIESILAGAWGCLSKQDDNIEQLRLIRRALDGHTAYSRSFQPALMDPLHAPGPDRPDARLLLLTRQEMNAAIGLAKGMTNRQIAEEMFLGEKTVKNMVSSVLAKLRVSCRSQAAVLVTTALRQSEDVSAGRYRLSLFPDLAAEVSAALRSCTSEARAVPPTDDERARRANRLADALAAARPDATFPLPSQARLKSLGPNARPRGRGQLMPGKLAGPVTA